MSKKIMLAKDLRSGDTIRLVYEIVIDEMGDLDTKFPSESDNLFFIKGTVIKGPLHKLNVETEFAISGDDKINVVKRKSLMTKVFDHLSQWSKTGEKKSPRSKAVLPSKHNSWSGLT